MAEPVIIEDNDQDSLRSDDDILRDIMDTEQKVKKQRDSLVQIRKMVVMTKKNMNHHISTVSGLKNNLLKMNGKRVYSETALQRKHQRFDDNQEGIPQTKIDDFKNLMDRRNSEVKDKLFIVDTLLGINGSMKQFSNELESKLHNAFQNSAGRIYGKRKNQVPKYSKTLKFDAEGIQNLENAANEYLSKSKFCR
mmetsp:Transcript_15958/g.13934  ORF Transcript_15958/g.13934 Transcript_15958/m.13934 type:complete len:194 (+) Transcript_15958:459-1040(+)